MCSDHEPDTVSGLRVPLLVAMKLAALKQNGEPYWRFNGPRSHYLYSLTPKGKEVFEVRDRRISRKKLLHFRDAVPKAATEEWFRPAAEQLRAGEITLPQFRDQVATGIKRLYINQYVLARGGRVNMTFADWGRLGAQLKKQYGQHSFLERFVHDLGTDQGQEWSEAYIANRLRLYAESSTQAFEWAQAVSLGLPANDMWAGRPLPQFPGDGGTACLTRCGCHWSIEIHDDVFHCYWKLQTGKKHCEDCIRNSKEWNPLVIARTEALPDDFFTGDFQSLDETDLVT